MSRRGNVMLAAALLLASLGAGVIWWGATHRSTQRLAAADAGVTPPVASRARHGAGAPGGTTAPRASSDSGLLDPALCPPMNSVPPPSPGSLGVDAAGGRKPHLTLVEERVKADCMAPENRAIPAIIKAMREAGFDAQVPRSSSDTLSYVVIENHEARAVQFDVGPSSRGFCYPTEALIRAGERFMFQCVRKKTGSEHYVATPITAWRVVRLKVDHLSLRSQSPGFTCEKPFAIHGRLRNEESVIVERPEVAVSLVAPSGELADVVATQLPNEIRPGQEVEFVAEGNACGPVRVSQAVAVASEGP